MRFSSRPRRWRFPSSFGSKYRWLRRHYRFSLSAKLRLLRRQKHSARGFPDRRHAVQPGGISGRGNPLHCAPQHPHIRAIVASTTGRTSMPCSSARLSDALEPAGASARRFCLVAFGKVFAWTTVRRGFAGTIACLLRRVFLRRCGEPLRNAPARDVPSGRRFIDGCAITAWCCVTMMTRDNCPFRRSDNYAAYSRRNTRSRPATGCSSGLPCRISISPRQHIKKLKAGMDMRAHLGALFQRNKFGQVGVQGAVRHQVSQALKKICRIVYAALRQPHPLRLPMHAKQRARLRIEKIGKVLAEHHGDPRQVPQRWNHPASLQLRQKAGGQARYASPFRPVPWTSSGEVA